MVCPFTFASVVSNLSFRTKDQKVGEGTYAVVYRGKFSWVFTGFFFWQMVRSGREVSTGRKVAIKKIKVGQFKDGLDMSAIREVKYLRELQHQNVIEVSSKLRCYLRLLRFLSSLTCSLRKRIWILSWNFLIPTLRWLSRTGHLYSSLLISKVGWRWLSVGLSTVTGILFCIG